MSWYYNYYLGYKKDNIIHPLGYFDRNGKLLSVFIRSKSFASDLHSDFYKDSDKLYDMLDDKFKEFLHLTNDYHNYISYLDAVKLKSGSYIKKGYFLEEEIRDYEDENCTDIPSDIFTEILTENAYIRLMQRDPEKAKDYSYYCYEDCYCKEYEIQLLYNAIGNLLEYERYVDIKDVVVICLEG